MSNSEEDIKNAYERNGVHYDLIRFYNRLQISENDEHKSGNENTPHILCPICHLSEFKLQYGEWEIKAICKCGHSMTVYDG